MVQGTAVYLGFHASKNAVKQFKYPLKMAFSEHLYMMLAFLSPQATLNLNVVQPGMHKCHWESSSECDAPLFRKLHHSLQQQ